MLELSKSEIGLNDAIVEMWRCSQSPSHFAVSHVKTIDIEKNEIRPFPNYPYLMGFLEENRIPRNEHVEKSRQMLVSWAFMALFLWDIQFKENVADFVTSRKEWLVDDGGSMSTPNSLLGRVRFMWDHLPDFLKMPLEFSYLKITNPATNSFILGESSNPNAGRSGTWHRALMDEAALIPKSENVFSSIYQACKSGTYMNSTPYGRGGCFGRIRFDPESSFEKRTISWGLHPDRDKKWYERQAKNMTDDQVARELDISYEKSIAGQIWKSFDFAKQVGDYPYDQDLPLYRGWDFGVGNPTFILWIQERPVPGWSFPEIRIIDECEQSEQEPPYYARLVSGKPFVVTDNGKKSPKEAVADFGDPAGKQREINMKSWISWLGELGIRIRVRHGMRISDSIMAGKRLIPYVRIDKKCARFQECISNYKHPTDEQGTVIGDGYENNWATHGMKAFEYYAVNRFPLKGAKWEAI